MGTPGNIQVADSFCAASLKPAPTQSCSLPTCIAYARMLAGVLVCAQMHAHMNTGMHGQLGRGADAASHAAVASPCAPFTAPVHVCRHV